MKPETREEIAKRFQAEIQRLEAQWPEGTPGWQKRHLREALEYRMRREQKHAITIDNNKEATQ